MWWEGVYVCAKEEESWGGFLEADTEKKAPHMLTWANPLHPPIVPGKEWDQRIPNTQSI